MSQGKITGADPNEFRIPASDTKGHSNREYFRCQPGHAQQINMFVQSGKFPYRTRADLIRHAVVRHLRWLHTFEAGVPNIMSQVDAILEVVRQEEMQQEFKHVINKTSETVNGLLADGADGEARRMILKVKEHVNAMPDGYWKDKYQREIGQRFDHLLKSGAKANLGMIAGNGGEEG